MWAITDHMVNSTCHTYKESKPNMFVGAANKSPTKEKLSVSKLAQQPAVAQ